MLRPSPRYKPASLFITCIADVMYPQTGVAIVEILEYLGVDVRFPQAQTCCGQPAFNGGFWDEARVVAKQFLTEEWKGNVKPRTAELEALNLGC